MCEDHYDRNCNLSSEEQLAYVEDRLARMEIVNEQLREENHRLFLLQSDLTEWHETFAAYGCEPQACLHTLQQQQGEVPDTPVSSPDRSAYEMRAEAWEVVWDTLLECGMREFYRGCEESLNWAGCDKACAYLRHLYAHQAETPLRQYDSLLKKLATLLLHELAEPPSPGVAKR